MIISDQKLNLSFNFFLTIYLVFYLIPETSNKNAALCFKHLYQRSAAEPSELSQLMERQPQPVFPGTRVQKVVDICFCSSSLFWVSIVAVYSHASPAVFQVLVLSVVLLSLTFLFFFFVFHLSFLPRFIFAAYKTAIAACFFVVVVVVNIAIVIIFIF